MLTTANQIIERALVKARVIYPGESIPSVKASQILTELNDLLDSWSLENLMILCPILEYFTPTGSQSLYTYGSGGEFNSDRPNSLTDGCYLIRGEITIPLELVPVDSFIRSANLGDKEIIAYNPEYPLGKVMIWPIPEASDVIYLSTLKQLTGFAALTTSVDLPPGYRRAIVANLAMEISPNFGKKITTELAALANDGKNILKSSNTTKPKPMAPSELTSMMRRY